MNGSGKIVQLVDPSNNQDAATKRYVDTSIPVGGIIMWSGTIASIPTNWRLCDGTTYGSLVTPDLRNRFIIGASLDTATTHATGGSGGITRAHTSIETPTNYVTGGSKDAVVVSHNHGGNTNGGTSDGTHTHTITSPSNSSTVAAVTLLNITPAYNFAGGQLDAAIAKQDLTASSSGSGHYHAISTDGEAGTNKNLPPYYALAFIMRIS